MIGLEAKQLYSFWTRDGEHPDVGATMHLAKYLFQNYRSSQWASKEPELRSRAFNALRAGEPAVDEAEHRKRSLSIVMHAVFAAQDFLDDKIERESARSQPKKQNGVLASAVEAFRTVVGRAVKSAEQPVPTIPSPFPKLNRMLGGGFRRGELVYLGARPSIGKSALASEFACHITRAGHTVLVFSREMSNEAVARRMVAQEGRIEAEGLRTGKNVDWQRVAATVSRMYDFPLWMDDKAHSIDGFKQTLLALPQKPDVVIVDYLQLITAPNTIRDRRQQIEWVSKELKQLTLASEATWIVLSSLTRPDTKNKGWRPTLASLKESGNLEHDADVVLLLHREENTNETSCLVAKNREGATGVVELVFAPEILRFEEKDDGTTAPHWTDD